MKEKLKNFRWGYIILFAILVAIGVLSFIFHDMLVYVVLAIGIIMALYGIGYGIFTIASKNRGPVFAFRIAITVSSIVAGVITMIFCKSAIEILTSILGLFLIIDGAFKFQTTAMSKRYRSAIWWVLLVPAVLTIIGGFFIIKISPDGSDSNLKFISVLLGITTIIDGISNLLSAFFTERNDKLAAEDATENIAEDATETNDNSQNAAGKSDEPTAESAPEASEAKASAEHTDAAEAAEPTEKPEDNADGAADKGAGDDTAKGGEDFKIEIPAIDIPQN